MPFITYWYDVPESVIKQQRADGVKKPIARVALRPLTGEDEEAALRACGTSPLLLREKLVQRSLCGVAFADAEDKAGPEMLVNVGQSDPDLQPSNLHASMHIIVVSLIGQAFGDICDGDSDVTATFRKSRKGVMA